MSRPIKRSTTNSILPSLELIQAVAIVVVLTLFIHIISTKMPNGKFVKPLYFSVLFFFLLLTATHAGAAVVTYPAPSGGIPLSNAFTVSADGANVDVYQVKVEPVGTGYNPCPPTYEIASMAYFDFSGTVNVKITSAEVARV